jgi:pimeloyl-ACP methyl ester carboxylesterase
LTSPADDAERKRKMVAQVHGPVLLVGHSYGGAVISVAGNAPNVAGFVYIAAFAPGAGESAGGITQERMAARLQARKIITLNASHASLASRPVEVAARILEAAGAVAGA